MAHLGDDLLVDGGGAGHGVRLHDRQVPRQVHREPGVLPAWRVQGRLSGWVLSSWCVPTSAAAWEAKVLAWNHVADTRSRLEMFKQVGACPCHTCSCDGHLISGMVMRFSGSTSSMRGMRSRAPGDRWLGRL